jgi:hypothetical protein
MSRDGSASDKAIRSGRGRHTLWARHPAVFEALRGRPRRWFDPSEELWVQQRAVRRALRVHLAPLLPGDPELAAVLTRVDAGERFLRYAAWSGAVLSGILLIAFVMWSRSSSGSG